MPEAISTTRARMSCSLKIAQRKIGTPSNRTMLSRLGTVRTRSETCPTTSPASRSCAPTPTLYARAPFQADSSRPCRIASTVMRILGSDLDTNRRRTSVKWRAFPPDVLPLWVAEMDAMLAPPVAAEIIDLIERGDTGYPWPAPYVEAFVDFAAELWHWNVTPHHVRLVT